MACSTKEPFQRSKFILHQLHLSTLTYYLMILNVIQLTASSLSWSNTSNINFNSSKEFPVSSHLWRLPNLKVRVKELLVSMSHLDGARCTLKPPLTRIIYHKSTGKRILYMDRRIRSQYILCPTDCCYRRISRMCGKYSENVFQPSPCIYFEKAAILDPTIDIVYVKCNRKNNGKLLYSNVHILLPEGEAITKRLAAFKRTSKKPIKVLILGISNISKDSFNRSLPKTAKYLQDNGWLEMMARYNEVGKHACKTILCILFGTKNQTDSNESQKYFENPHLIWKLYQNAGYVTAFGEDFEDNQTCLEDPPADYYLKPGLLAAKYFLPMKEEKDMKKCIGFQTTTEYVFDYALNFVRKHRYDPYLGMFWSHYSGSELIGLDPIMKDYFEEFDTLGVKNETVVLFVSDRRLNLTHSLQKHRYLEDTLPFLFISLPPWLEDAHPDFVNAFRSKKNIA